ncbi:hypothetical protein EJB05_32775 [Eragrostis curvula]|uniref:PUM-HD domain-containing protein n=1 Tax=Eragrostis curvula TaxID=38414 RepID=A0A5J9UH40_9POAL|nr:hypothetical protein EJB05_32775 [Eragrostis curvula]
MEESQGNQDGSRFGAFVDKVPGAVQGSSAGDMEFHQRSSGSLAAGGYLNGTRPLPSEFALYDASMVGSNQHLYDEQSLISAIEGLNLRTRAADMPNNHRNAALTNGHYPSGRVDVTLDQPRVSATHQDESMPPRFSPAYANQKADELAFENREQPYRFAPHSPHLGNFSRSSRQPNCDVTFSIPYNPSTATASPFQQHCYVDGQSPMYAPYDQSGSNFLPRAQSYSVMQPHYIYPQTHQVTGLDVPRNRRSNQQAAVCTPANGASSYLGTPNFHELGSGDCYLNGATFQRSNGWLNSTFTDRFPSTSYTNGSCGSSDFRQFQQHEKVAYPYGPGLSQHKITGNSTISYPERTIMRTDGVDPVRSIKFFPSANGCADMDQRTNGYGHNYLDIQRNNSFSLDWLKPQFLSKSESESAMESPQLTYNSVDEVVGRICIVATDQNGCRFLQKVFTEGTKDDADKVFAEIIDHITELMVDPFAHYLVQKILDECSNDQRMSIICEITKVPADLLKVSCNMHGTRVVQKVVETINTPEQALKVISALSPGAMRLMTDPNGSHVVHRCLQKLLPEHKAFLLDVAASRYLQLARDRHGCCVLQKCIEHSNEDQKNNLLNNITSGALRLSEDQYGNYVIQFILSLKIEWATSKIVDELEGHFGNLSMQKCGSHVVEQCLKLAPQLVRDRIIIELMNDPKLPHVMLDQYGNYVIQTALKESKGVQHSAFVEAIRPHAAALQSNMFGKKVLSRTYLKNKQYRLGIF